MTLLSMQSSLSESTAASSLAGRVTSFANIFCFSYARVPVGSFGFLHILLSFLFFVFFVFAEECFSEVGAMEHGPTAMAVGGGSWPTVVFDDGGLDGRSWVSARLLVASVQEGLWVDDSSGLSNVFDLAGDCDWVAVEPDRSNVEGSGNNCFATGAT
jgi:hypothetical protein